MCILLFFTQQSWGRQPQHLGLHGMFPTALSSTHGWVLCLDLCSFKFLLVQYLMICMKCCKMYPWRAPLHVGEYPPCARIRLSITCVHAIISLWRTCRLLIICLTCAYFCPNSAIHYECVYCCFSHSNLEKTAPTPWTTWNVFRPLYVGGTVIGCCVI